MLATRSALPYATATPPIVPLGLAAMDTPPPFSPPKRWQFSLKSLLILTTAVAVLLGLGGLLQASTLVAWLAITLLTKGVAVALGTCAYLALKPEHRIILAAGAIGAWTPAVTAAMSYNLFFSAGIVALSTLVQSSLCIVIAWQTLNFARNRGWSRF